MRVFGKTKLQDFYLVTCLVNIEESKKLPSEKLILRNKRIGIVKTKESLEPGKEYDVEEIKDKLEDFSEPERQFLNPGKFC